MATNPSQPIHAYEGSTQKEEHKMERRPQDTSTVHRLDRSALTHTHPNVWVSPAQPLPPMAPPALLDWGSQSKVTSPVVQINGLKILAHYLPIKKPKEIASEPTSITAIIDFQMFLFNTCISLGAS